MSIRGQLRSLSRAGYAVEISPLELHYASNAYAKIKGFTDLVP